MAADSFLLQLGLFVAVQVAAWGNMVTGRFPLGFVQFALALGLADALLLMRFVAGEAGPLWTGSLTAFQGFAAAAAVEFAWRRLRRRSAAFRRRQDTAWIAALDAFLAGRDTEALGSFRRLFRKDPWDAESACMVARILARAERRVAARFWYGRARARSRRLLFRDEIDEEVKCLRARTAPRRPKHGRAADIPKGRMPARRRSRAAG